MSRKTERTSWAIRLGQIFVTFGAVAGYIVNSHQPADELRVRLFIICTAAALVGLLLGYLVDLVIKFVGAVGPAAHAPVSPHASMSPITQSERENTSLEAQLDEVERLFAVGKISSVERAEVRARILVRQAP
jgi:hypothetical protein